MLRKCRPAGRPLHATHGLSHTRSTQLTRASPTIGTRASSHMRSNSHRPTNSVLSPVAALEDTAAAAKESNAKMCRLHAFRVRASHAVAIVAVNHLRRGGDAKSLRACCMTTSRADHILGRHVGVCAAVRMVQPEVENIRRRDAPRTVAERVCRRSLRWSPCWARPWLRRPGVGERRKDE